METILHAIDLLFQEENVASLILAPAGMGKTTLAINFFQQNSRTIFFVSPLRALAVELHHRLQQLNIPNSCALTALEMKNILQQKKSLAVPHFYIITPEIFSDEFWHLTQIQKNESCHYF